MSEREAGRSREEVHREKARELFEACAHGREYPNTDTYSKGDCHDCITDWLARFEAEVREQEEKRCAQAICSGCAKGLPLLMCRCGCRKFGHSGGEGYCRADGFLSDVAALRGRGPSRSEERGE